LGAFRTRARSIPTLVFTNGVAYAITFLVAKSSRTAIEIGLKASSCEEAITNAYNTAKEAKIKDTDELGYWLYSAVISYIMKHTGITNATSFKNLIEEFIGNPASGLKARIVFEWTKRFTEAYIMGVT